MATTSQDVLTDPDFLAIVQRATEQTLAWRRAFRELDLPEGAGPNASLPTMPDGNEFFDDEDITEIPEGSEYPRADPAAMGEAKVATTKKGVETAITDEAVSRGLIDVQLDMASAIARTEERRLDTIAGSVVLANVSGTAAGDADGTLSWLDLLDAHGQLVGADYSPDLLVVGQTGQADLLADERISNRSVGMSDDAISGASLPNLLGMTPVLVNRGGLGDSDAILIDTDFYGYEATEPIGAGPGGVSSYREESKDQTVYKIRSFKGWAATDADAAVHVDG